MRRSGRRCTCTVASVMIPSRPSLPRIISRTLGPVEVAGTGARDEHAGRRDDAHGAREVGDVAVLVGLHARRAGRDPAAERRVGEAVGEVAERPARRVELLLEVGAERAGLDPGEARRVVDLEHAVHARPCRPRRPCASSSAGASRLPEMFVPPPNGMSDGVGVERRAHDRLDLASLPGRTTTSGRRPRSPRAVADEVAQALAARVDDAVQRVGRDVRRRRRPPRARRAGRREDRLGDVELVEADRPRGEAVDAHVDVALDERSRARACPRA